MDWFRPPANDTFGESEPNAGTVREEPMDWWQTAGLMGTLVLTGTAVATFGWRVLRRETDKLREESRHAHDRIGGDRELDGARISERWWFA